MVFRRFRRGAGRRGRASYQRRSLRRTEAPSIVRGPRIVPAIQQVAKSMRWVRFTMVRPVLPALFQLALSSLWQAIFGTGTTCVPGSHFYLHAIRFWTRTAAANTTMIIDVGSSPVLPAGSEYPAVRYRSDTTADGRNACIAVSMPEIWKITPIGATSTAIVAYIQQARTDAVDLANIFCDCKVYVVERGPNNVTVTGEQVTLEDLDLPPPEMSVDGAFEMLTT